ncbi:MAG: ATP-binding protein [Treponema sp.]|nr:ATP-binding protein [Treponema sp.]
MAGMKKDGAGFKVLDSISVITKKLAKSGLKIKRTKEFSEAEERLNSYFKTTSGGTWMLCGIISYYFDHGGNTCNFNNLSEFFCMPVMGVIAYKDDVESLLSKGYIINTMGLNEEEVNLKNEFELSTELLSSILHNKKISITKRKKKSFSITDMIRKTGELIEGNASEFEKTVQIIEMEAKYKDNDFFRKTMQLLPRDILSRMFFYDCCSDMLAGHTSNLNSTINDVYEDVADRFFVGKSFLNDDNILLKTGLLEFTNKGNMSDSQLEITSKAKEMLLGENARLFLKSAKGTDIIRPEDIKQTPLFYSKENEAEIQRLKSSLHEEKLRTIQGRLSEKGLARGIAVLLYGAPGTGKTESVYQIARETGREILHVDISSSKSCWFGESEKIIKKIFTDYKQMCKSAGTNADGKMPILLFNEADGILSKRRESTSGNLAQTENAMQNIILEEMEKLEGIMICTTNLADNLDPAFERRFLFKIKFENPTLEVKEKIWRSKLEWLDEDEIAHVAGNYDLSGGQIDNIVRKITMNEVLTGKRPNHHELSELCKNERLGSVERKIGFF